MPDQPALRVVIAEDEPLARELLGDMLSDHGDIEIVAVCETGADAVRVLQDVRADLLLLDIQMPELDGFGVLRELPPERTPAVVFITAFDDYAVQAFEVDALDYLLKPFSDDRLAATLERVRHRIRTLSAEQLQEELTRTIAQWQPRSAPSLRRIAVPDGEGTRLLAVQDVQWIEAAGKYVRIHAEGGAHLVRDSIGRLEDRLDPSLFVRVSRSAIVNLDRVREIQKWFHGQYILLLENGAKITTTRTYRAQVDAVLENRP